VEAPGFHLLLIHRGLLFFKPAGIIELKQRGAAMHKILIIDDDESICETLSLYLSEEGYDVITAGTGAEGINAFKLHKADLVILDIRLPDINGFTVLKNLKIIDKDAKVIMISAFHDMTSLLHAMAAGALKCIGKPVSISELESAIESALH
jgi:two-component system response regulator AtoC